MSPSLRRASLAIVLALVACTAAPAPGASPVTTEKAAITDRTASELVAVMTAWQAALAKKDLTGFQATIDLTRPAFRRCQTEAFDVAARQGFSTFDVKVAKVEPYLDTYVRAYVGDDNAGYSRMYFRREGGSWIRSEPLDTELGGDKTASVNGLQLSYYGIDSDVIETYAASGNDARAFLLTQAEGHTSTGQAFGLRIFPTRGAAGPNVGCGVAGFHLTNVPSDPFIRLFSNALSFRAGLTAVTDSTASIIRHEGLHWLQDQFIAGITARMPFWLVEGGPTTSASRGASRRRRTSSATRRRPPTSSSRTACCRRPRPRRSCRGSTTHSRTRWSSTSTAWAGRTPTGTS